MEVAIHLPEDIARQLAAKWGDLSHRTLEAVAVAAYRDGILTAAEVGGLLGHSSRWQTEVFLHDAGARLHYTRAELDDEQRRLRDA